MATYRPVHVVASGGLPVTDTSAAWGEPMTVVESISNAGIPVTIVTQDGRPVRLYDEAGDPYSP